MPSQRFPIGDGREVVLSWKPFEGYVYLRIDGEFIEKATLSELRKCVVFEDLDGTEIHVVAVQGIPWLPQFDVYYAGRLLPHSVGDPAWARRTVIELLLLVGVYDFGAIAELFFVDHRWPTSLVEWGRGAFVVASIIISAAVARRVPAASGWARGYMLLRALLSIGFAGAHIAIDADLGTLWLYIWMKHATRTVEAIDAPPALPAAELPAMPPTKLMPLP